MVEDGIAEYANPASINRAAVMMLRHIGFTDQRSSKKSPMKHRMPSAFRATGPAKQQRLHRIRAAEDLIMVTYKFPGI